MRLDRAAKLLSNSAQSGYPHKYVALYRHTDQQRDSRADGINGLRVDIRAVLAVGNAWR